MRIGKNLELIWEVALFYTLPGTFRFRETQTHLRNLKKWHSSEIPHRQIHLQVSVWALIKPWRALLQAVSVSSEAARITQIMAVIDSLLPASNDFVWEIMELLFFLCCIHSHLYSFTVNFFICNYKQYPGLRHSSSLCKSECDCSNNWSDSCHPFRILLTPAQWIIFNPHEGLGNEVWIWVSNFLFIISYI